MLSMRAAWAAGASHARASSPTAKATTVVTSNPAKPGAELGFLSTTLKRVLRMRPWETAPGIDMGGPSYAGKMACGPGCKGAAHVAHTAGVTQDGTNCSVRLHRRDTVDSYGEAPSRDDQSSRSR